MKLLVPVDGSMASLNAVQMSAEIAKKYGFSITLLTVVDVREIPRYRRNERLWRQVDGSMIVGGAMMPMEDEITEKFRENAAEMLDSIVLEIDFAGVKLEKKVLMGEPYEMILDMAREEKFDLIVMGNRGFSKIKRFFVGSVTQRVISEAPCPVLAVHAPAEE